MMPRQTQKLIDLLLFSKNALQIMIESDKFDRETISAARKKFKEYDVAIEFLNDKMHE